MTVFRGEDVKQLASMFLEDRKFLGDKIRDGDIESALIVSTIGHRGNAHDMCEALEKEYRRWLIPEGLLMPWGKIVPIKSNRA